MSTSIPTATGLETVLEKVGRSLSDRFGIRVVCQGNECATNGRTIFLPSLPDPMPIELLQVIRGYLDHESGHLLGESDFHIFRWFKSTYGPDAAFYLNMLEDLRIEEFMCQRFPGSRKNLAAAHFFLLAEAEKEAGTMHLWRQLAFGVHSCGNRVTLPSFVGFEIRQVLDVIQDDLHKVSRCLSTEEVGRIAESTWPIVSTLFSPPPPSSAVASADADYETGRSGTISTQPEQSPAVLSKDENQIEDFEGSSPSSHSSTADTDREKHGTGTTGAGNDAVKGQERSYQKKVQTGNCTRDGDAEYITNAVDQNQFRTVADSMRQLARSIVVLVNDHSRVNRAYRVWTTAMDSVSTAPNNSRMSHHKRIGKLLPLVAGVRQKLLQTLLAVPKARWLGEKEVGHINPRMLHRLVTSSLQCPGTPKVFRERIRTKRLHTAVTLLVDQSASMYGQKIPLAGNTALLLCEALSRLNIPCSVVGFTTGDMAYYKTDTEAKTGMTMAQLVESYRIAPLQHTYFKHFHEPLRSVSGRFECMDANGTTPLGESILFAGRGLSSRREVRKVMLVITDGCPTVGLADDAPTLEHAKASIRRVEKAGIDVALIGIMSGCVDIRG